MKKIMLILIFGIFFISMVSSESIYPAKVGESKEIYQTSNNATYCNFTSIKINGVEVINDVVATQRGTYFYYTISGGNFTEIGEGEYCYNIGNTVESSTGCITFKINPLGKEFTTGESIIYAILTLIVMSILTIMFYFIIALPKENKKDSSGFENGIVKLKYLRIMLIALTYPMLIVLLNLMNGLAVNFTTFSIFSGIIGFLFEVMLRLAWVFTFLIFTWIIILAVHDSNLKKQLKKIQNFRI